jgi:hypothetical protein
MWEIRDSSWYSDLAEKIRELELNLQNLLNSRDDFSFSSFCPEDELCLGPTLQGNSTRGWNDYLFGLMIHLRTMVHSKDSSGQDPSLCPIQLLSCYYIL